MAFAGPASTFANHVDAAWVPCPDGMASDEDNNECFAPQGDDDDNVSLSTDMLLVMVIAAAGAVAAAIGATVNLQQRCVPDAGNRDQNRCCPRKFSCAHRGFL